MGINFFAVAVCGILAMVIGGIWYGPLFGKKWAEIVGADISSEEARKKMQSKAMPLYVTQFVLTLFQVGVFAFLLQTVGSAVATLPALIVWTTAAFVIWIAFVMPTIAGSAMWNNDTRRVAFARFFIQAGYQLIIFLMFGVILGFWR